MSSNASSNASWWENPDDSGALIQDVFLPFFFFFLIVVCAVWISCLEKLKRCCQRTVHHTTRFFRDVFHCCPFVEVDTYTMMTIRKRFHHHRVFRALCCHVSDPMKLVLEALHLVHDRIEVVRKIREEGRDPNSGKSPYFVEYNELPQFTDDLLDGMAAVIREQEQIFESYQNPDILPMIYDNEQVMDRWNGDIDDMVRQDGRRQRGPVFRNPLPGENVNQNDSSSLLGNEEGPEIEEETPEVPPMIAGLDSRHPRMHLGVPDARAVADKREFWFLLARRLFLIPNKEKRLPPLETLSDLSMGRPPRLNRPETLTIEMEPDIHVCRTIGHLSLDDDIGLRDYDEHPQQGEDPRQHQDNDQEENKVVDNDAPVEEGAIAVMLQASEGEYARVKEENVRVARAAAALEERRQQAGVNAGPPGGYVPKKKQGKLNEFLKETTGRIQLSRDGIREGEGQGQVARNHGEAVNVESHEGASGRAILGQNQILVISDDEDAARNIEISSGHDLSKSFMEEDQEKEEKDKKKD